MKKIISILALLTIGTASVSYASIDKNLKYGQRDGEVTELQQFLVNKGLLKTTPSNYFGALTLKAVKAYQVSIGISSTGFIGTLTREKINKELASGGSTSNQVTNSLQSTVNSPSVVDNTTNTTNDASTSPNYGVGFVMSDGTKILSPLKSYGYYKEIVTAEKNGLHGTYNQTTKVFLSDIEAQKRDDVYQAGIRLGYTSDKAKQAVTDYINTGYSSLLPNQGQQVTQTSTSQQGVSTQATSNTPAKVNILESSQNNGVVYVPSIGYSFWKYTFDVSSGPVSLKEMTFNCGGGGDGGTCKFPDGTIENFKIYVNGNEINKVAEVTSGNALRVNLNSSDVTLNSGSQTVELRGNINKYSAYNTPKFSLMDILIVDKKSNTAITPLYNYRTLSSVEGAKVTLDPSRMPRCEDYRPVISGISIQPANGSSISTGDALQAVVGDTLIIDGDNLMPSSINCFDSIKSPQGSGSISLFGINLKSKLANTNMGFASDGTPMIFSPDARKVKFVIPRGVNENDSSRTFTVSVQNQFYGVGSYISQDTTQTVTIKNNP